MLAKPDSILPVHTNNRVLRMGKSILSPERRLAMTRALDESSVLPVCDSCDCHRKGRNPDRVSRSLLNSTGQFVCSHNIFAARNRRELYSIDGFYEDLSLQQTSFRRSASGHRPDLLPL